MMDKLAQRLRKRIEPLGNEVAVRNASRNPLSVLGNTELTVQLRYTVKKVKFVVTDKLSIAIVFGCDYYGLHIDAIRPRLKSVHLDNGTTVPIISETFQLNTSVPFREEQQLEKQKDSAKPKIKVTGCTILQPSNKTWF